MKIDVQTCRLIRHKIALPPLTCTILRFLFSVTDPKSVLKAPPGLTSIKEKNLSYSFIHEVYGKNAYRTKLIQIQKGFEKSFKLTFLVCLPLMKLSGH